MKYIQFIFLFFIFNITLLPKNKVDDLLHEILIQVQYPTVRYSKVYPWIKEMGEEYNQYGVIIDKNKVLTQCDELLHSISIDGKYKNQIYKLNLDIIDLEVNLCVLSSSQNFKDYNLKWYDYPLGNDPNIKDTIEVFYYDEYNQIKYNKFIVQEYDITSDYGFTKLPVFTVNSTSSLMNGSLAFSKDKIVGFLSYSNNKKLIFIPVSRFKFFVDFYLENKYSGFVFAGLELKPVFDELKNYFNLSNEESGCFVKEIMIHSSSYKIFNVGDIITEIDGIKPNKKCLYKDPLLGYQKLELLFSRNVKGEYRKVDDSLKIKIIRDKKLMDLNIFLKSLFSSPKGVERIPWKVYGMQPYLIQHGIIFIELSHSFLVERLGKNWRQKALELAFLYDTKKYYQSENENDKIVVISDILPDPINIGYQNILLKPVIKVNKKELKNLKHLYQEIQESKKLNSILELELSDQKKLYFDLSKEKEHNDILRKFQIPSDHYINN